MGMRDMEVRRSEILKALSGQDIADKAKAKDKKNLEARGPQAEVAEIVYHGDQLILPDGMGFGAAIQLLVDRQEYMEKTVTVMRKYDALPFDGANALNEVLSAKYGWAQSIASPGFFGENPPSMMMIETGPGKTKQVPWGRFSLPGIEGYVQTDVTKQNGRFQFLIHGQIMRKDEKTVNDVLERVAAHLNDHSIYRGQALKIRFRDDDGDPIAMPEPKFIDTSKIDRSQLIYSESVMDAVETNLFAPIERVADFMANGLPVKRAVLLEGTYGTGKTLAATVAGKIAVDNEITYLYCARADELPEALEFAKQYQNPACVVFCEDVDRALDGERDAEMDNLLNTIDGVDSKHANVIIVLTSNAVENINVAMLRPGRLDAVISITPPDAKAVEKLVRHIGGEAIDPQADLTEVGRRLAGQIPAVISEVVKRAKIVQLRRQAPGTTVRQLSGDSLLEAAVTMESQLKLLAEKIAAETPETPALDRALADVIAAAVNGNKVLAHFADQYDLN